MGLFWWVSFAGLVAMPREHPVLKLEQLAVGTLSFMVLRMNSSRLFLPSVQFPKMMCLEGALPGPPKMCTPSALCSRQGSLAGQVVLPEGLGLCCFLLPLCLPPRLQLPATCSSAFPCRRFIPPSVPPVLLIHCLLR